ncbi:MAG: PD-(D/E)XK nuclease family protein, partial [Thermoguttaceae bacterium]|nr:PD-(D/E)XK nuclease family protein [Thermoguttaceae bacterium]
MSHRASKERRANQRLQTPDARSQTSERTEIAARIPPDERYRLRVLLVARALPIPPEERVRPLPAPDPKTNELDAAKFGTVIHDLLRAFGKDPNIRDSRSPEAIGGWLSAKLNDYAKSFVNDHTSPFVKIQIEQIRERLWGFARWQAEWRKTGAKIVAVECGPEDGWIDFPIGDGEPSVSIVGRIDRVDFNSEKNRLYVFDYKTFDSFEQGKQSKEGGSLGYPGLEKTDELYKVDVDGQTKTLYSAYPGNTIDKKHRNRKRGEDAYVWTNLQMPLYRQIIWKIREEKPELFGGNPEPGAEEETK